MSTITQGEESELQTTEPLGILDSKENELYEDDRLEVLSLLPPYDGKSVLELGAGTGRFTGDLAKKAGQVIAVEFKEEFIKKNESKHEHYGNIKYMCADVASPELNFPADSMDIIVFDRLLVYLSDTQVEDLANRLVKWLKVGGFIFFRESCFHRSTESDRENDPIHYRGPRFYTKVFKECRQQDDSGNLYELSLVGFKCIGAHARRKKSQNEICWTWQKVSSEEDGGFQQFLDTVQYKSDGILRYERVFGQHFVSTGGIDTTREFVEYLDLQSGQEVLDVGCGIGGGDFYMAGKYGVHVVGIDLSVNMISFALERSVGLNCSVEFEVADCTKKAYPSGSFDVIYSRDTILHIQDKPSLFRSFYKWLKPGGKVLISDYCRNAGTPSSDFTEYIKQRGYDLHDVEAYGQMLKDAGFDEVIAEDRTDQFIKVLQKELDTIEKEKEDFISDFSEFDSMSKEINNVMKKPNLGRKKIEIKKIEHKSSRQVTFTKRRTGLFRKASELSQLAGAQIAIFVPSQKGKMFTFGHPNVETVIDQYRRKDEQSDEHCRKKDEEVDLSGAMRTLESLEARRNQLKELNRRLENNEGGRWWMKDTSNMELAEREKFMYSIQELKNNVTSILLGRALNTHNSR